MKFNFKPFSKIKKIFFVFLIFFVFIGFTAKSEARMLIDNTDVPGLSNQNDDVDILLLANGDYDMAWNTGDTGSDYDTHGTEKLSDADIKLVNIYLKKEADKVTANAKTYIQEITNALNKRPDIKITDITTTASGGTGGTGGSTAIIIKNNFSQSNAAENATIAIIKADPDFFRLTYVMIADIAVMTGQDNDGAYLKAFNYFTEMPDSQFLFAQDFQNIVGYKLKEYGLAKYIGEYENFILNNNSSSTPILKLRAGEIKDYAKQNISETLSLDAEGVGFGSQYGDKSIGLDNLFPSITSKFSQINTENDLSQITDATKEYGSDASQAGVAGCQATDLWGVINDGDCSFVAYIINNMIGLVNYLIGFINSAVGAIFGYIFDFSVIHFADWVIQSNAIVIYKTIILSLVTSLLLPLIFYLVIRMLIDNDSSNIKKLIPKILFTALFVYFSFGISGWVIDQSNIVTIYLYRSMTHTQNDKPQNIGEVMQRSLLLDKGNDVSQMAANQAGSPSTIGFSLGQLIINIVALFVIIQAMVLMFSRSVVLLLCMIFSPLMVLPAGLGGTIGNFIDEWRGKIMKYYSDNLLLGPVFMFLLFLAVKVGSLATNLTKDAPVLPGEPVSTGGQVTFLSGIMTTILVVILMQVAISVAKKLSGDLGGQISGKINDFVTKQGGNAVFGNAAKVMRGGVGKIANNEKFKGWVEKQQNTRPRLGKLISTSTDYLKNSTFDARKPLGVAGEALGVKGASTALGNPSTKTFQNTFDKNLNQKTKYIDGLTTKESKEAYINSLSSNIASSRQIKKDFTENKDNKAKEEELNKTLNKNPALKDHYESLDEDKKKEFTKQYTDPKNKEKNEIETKKINEEYKNKRERGEVKGLEDQYKNKKKANFFDAIKTDTDLKNKFNAAEDDEKEQEKIIQEWKDEIIENQKNINNYQKANTESIKNQTQAIENQTKNFANNMKNFSSEIGSLVDVLKKNQNNRNNDEDDGDTIIITNNKNNPTGGGNAKNQENSLDELLKANNINRLPKNNNLKGDIDNFSQN